MSEHVPLNPTGEGLALTHGASGDSNSPLLIAIGEAFAEAGIYVLRFNLTKGRSAPKDRDLIREAIAEVRKKVAGPVYAGGQSYGGRQTSMVAAEDSGIADALVLFSYPLHPPGKPDQLRTEHFPSLHIPASFVHGPKDPFATTDELEKAITLIPAKTIITEVSNAAHDLKKGRFPLPPVIAAVRSLAAKR